MKTASAASCIPASFHATPKVRAAIAARHAASRAVTPTESFAVGWLVPTDRCPTAYWKFDDKTGNHQIRINPLVYANITRQTDPTSPLYGRKVKFGQLFESVYDHERAHSKYSTRDLKGLGAKLRAEKIPWRLCNLFEDCRIERLWCYNEGVAFGWTAWDKKLDGSTPVGLLYALKVLGSNIHARLTPTRSKDVRAFRSFRRKWGKRGSHLSIVEHYYVRITSASTTEELIPILKDWLKTFPPTEEGNSPSEDSEIGGGGGDLGDAIDGASEGGSSENPDSGGSGGSIREQNDDGSFGSPSGEDGSKAPRESAEGEDTEQQFGEDGKPVKGSGEHGEGTYVGGFAPDPKDTPEQKHHKALATRLAAYLARAFKLPGDSTCNGPTPSKKLNVRGLIKNDFRNPYRVTRLSARAKVPSVSLVIDCSGSMNGYGTAGGITPDDVRAISKSDEIAYPADSRTDADIADFATPPRIQRRGPVNTGPVTADVHGISGAVHKSVAPNALVSDNAGRVLALALHLLAKRGLLSGNVYLSRRGGVSRRFALGTRDEKAFDYIYGDSDSEGLASTFSVKRGPRSALAEIVANSKVALVWTDGCITDGPIDRTPIRARGVVTVGLLSTLENRQRDIARHFDSAICRTSLFGVAADLVKLLRSGACNTPTR